jgi:hypothetical protein
MNDPWCSCVRPGSASFLHVRYRVSSCSFIALDHFLQTFLKPYNRRGGSKSTCSVGIDHCCSHISNFKFSNSYVKEKVKRDEINFNNLILNSVSKIFQHVVSIRILGETLLHLSNLKSDVHFYTVRFNECCIFIKNISSWLRNIFRFAHWGHATSFFHHILPLCRYIFIQYCLLHNGSLINSGYLLLPFLS